MSHLEILSTKYWIFSQGSRCTDHTELCFHSMKVCAKMNWSIAHAIKTIESLKIDIANCQSGQMFAGYESPAAFVHFKDMFAPLRKISRNIAV